MFALTNFKCLEAVRTAFKDYLLILQVATMSTSSPFSDSIRSFDAFLTPSPMPNDIVLTALKLGDSITESDAWTDVSDSYPFKEELELV